MFFRRAKNKKRNPHPAPLFIFDLVIQGFPVMTSSSTIRFYGAERDKPHWMFSNFAHLPLVMDGITFPSIEHYVQYSKYITTDPKHAEKLRRATTPYECRKLARMEGHTPDPEWRSKELRLMRIALFCKAIQHPSFKKALLDTGRSQLIEAAPHDYFWGEGRDRTGRNMLGQMLMQLRKNLYFSRGTPEEDEVPPNKEEIEIEVEVDEVEKEDPDAEEVIDEGWDDQARAECGEFDEDEAGDVEVEED